MLNPQQALTIAIEALTPPRNAEEREALDALQNALTVLQGVAQSRTVIVATATVARRDKDGQWIDYFGEGGADLLAAFKPGTTEDAIKAHILATLNADITRCGWGPEHHFTLGHMGYESFPDDAEIMWQTAVSEVL